MLDYYDRIVLAIPTSIGGGILLGLVTVLGFELGLLLGTLVATVFVYDAMFRHPPVPMRDPRTTAAAIVWHLLLLGVVFNAYTG